MPAEAGYSTIQLRPLHQYFAAQVTGVDLSQHLDDCTFEEISRAFDEHSVLVFPDQDLDNDSQARFSERFGDLERMLKGSVGNGSPFSGITNVDNATNEVFPADDHRMRRQLANEMWHTDSSFKAISARASLLHAKEVPPIGGDTLFIGMRQVWEDLAPDRQALCELLAAEHDFVYSRAIQNGEDFLSDEQKAEVPPVPQAMVLTNARNGRKALYIGAHAARIIGWPQARGRALLDELTAHATQEKYIYTHRWKSRELVMWDDRATLHRGAGWDHRRHRRVMVRTTVSGGTPTITPAQVERARAAAVSLMAQERVA